MPIRDISCAKLLKSVHFVGVILFILFNYYILVFEFMQFLNPHPYSENARIAALLIFHLFFLMLAWSMIQSVISDPGRVPIYWGFYAEQSDDEKRRYCLLCHNFKPERCHHCSTCQRCVLNMDHHCPWIGNCVGYFNRKFFILFLIYVILSLITALVIEIPLLIIQLKGLGTNYSFSFHTVLRIVGCLMQAGFFFVILVMTNSTTLDNLQRQRNSNAGANVYNVGSYQNFSQVFGTDVKYWALPIFVGEQAGAFGDQGPKGDGVTWKKNTA